MTNDRRCGYCLSADDCGVTDIDGCVLKSGHDGPHEFVDQDGNLYMWEYDTKHDCDVFWKFP